MKSTGQESSLKYWCDPHTQHSTGHAVKSLQLVHQTLAGWQCQDICYCMSEQQTQCFWDCRLAANKSTAQERYWHDPLTAAQAQDMQSKACCLADSALLQSATASQILWCVATMLFLFSKFYWRSGLLEYWIQWFILGHCFSCFLLCVMPYTHPESCFYDLLYLLFCGHLPYWFRYNNNGWAGLVLELLTRTQNSCLVTDGNQAIKLTWVGATDWNILDLKYNWFSAAAHFNWLLNSLIWASFSPY